jgi:hypothetical protein
MRRERIEQDELAAAEQLGEARPLTRSRRRDDKRALAGLHELRELRERALAE